VTLRGFVPVTEMAKAVAAVTPAPVPATAPPTPAASTVTYKQWGTIAGNPVFVKIPTVTTLTQSGATTYASVAPQPGYPSNPRPLGTVTFVRTRAGIDTILGSVSIADFGGDSPFFNTSPAAGDAITVVYAGDGVYMASTSSTVPVAGVTVTVSPLTPNALACQNQAFSAVVTGSADTAVAWSVAPGGATISAAGVFWTMTPGSYNVTATSRADPSVSASVAFTVGPAPLGVTGRIGDILSVIVTQCGGGYPVADVKWTTSAGTVTALNYGGGLYEFWSNFALPPAGQTVTLTVTGPGGVPSVIGTATVPTAPTITAPAFNSNPLAANPITVQWTSPAPDPQEFWLEGTCGTNACVPNPTYWPTKWVSVAGAARSAVLPAGFFPAGTSVGMALKASNKLVFTGNVAADSSVDVFARATGPTWWQFIPSAGASTWVTGTAAMAFPRFTHAVGNGGVSNGSKLYVIGGMADNTYTAPITAVEIYDIPTGTWSTATGAGPVTSFFQANVEVGTGLRLLGGQSSGTMQNAVGSYQEYHGYNNTWSTYPVPGWPGMNTARTKAAAAPMVYVPNAPTEPIWMISGGFNSSGVLNSAETMNGYGQWATTAPMPTARMDHAAALVGTRFYAIGGRDLNFTPLPNVEYYDKGTNTWTAAPSLPAPLYGAATAVIGTKLYVMGGATTGLTVTSTVLVLDTASPNPAWTPLPSLPVAVAYPAATVVGNTIYLVGGNGGPTTAYPYIQTFTP
jgi:hypothetical protein